jgi:hypothetical protein
MANLSRVAGDHEPPALVTGEGAPWDVPIHVIAKGPAILESLLAHGFARAFTPRRPHLGKMDESGPS